MVLALILLIIFLTLLIIFVNLYKINSKAVLAILVLLTFVISSTVCVLKPQIHKPFSIDVIEYFIKINDDGSMTTTKQVTKTVIKDKQQEGSEK